MPRERKQWKNSVAAYKVIQLDDECGKIDAKWFSLYAENKNGINFLRSIAVPFPASLLLKRSSTYIEMALRMCVNKFKRYSYTICIWNLVYPASLT